jgi:membrane protease YdiL (CAAX protease family)
LLLIFAGGWLAGATINGFFAFGEELGWRGLMLVETQQWGFWRSNALIGLVWGLWHAPVILMGYNYPGHPFAGVGMMMLFCLAGSYPLAYVAFKSRSILAPSIFHGNINAIAGGAMLFISEANPLAGGLVGTVSVLAFGLITLGIVLFDPDFVKQYRQQSYLSPASPPSPVAETR